MTGSRRIATLSFEGYERPGGSVGVRDRVLVLPSVICSHMVADRIADRVDGAVSAPHDHGCAQIGSDNEQTERTFLGVARNPNVAGTLVVGLGCEHVQSDAVAAQLDDLGVPVRELSIQGVGGTDPTIERGAEAARDLRETTRAGSTAADASDLTLGIVCTDLAEGTVETAAPLVGALAETVTAAGGRVVAAGIEPLLADPDAARAAASGDAAEAVDDLLARHEGHPAKTRTVERAARAQPFAATTRAWGEGPIRDVLAYGEPATHDRGLAVVDAPSQFTEAATGLVAAGAQVVVHVTDEGVPTGHPLAPVVKVSGNEATCEALADDIDVDATTATAVDLRERVGDVLRGGQSRTEAHGVTDFAITRVGPSM
ncbi:UxaA family hydrolase [Haloplanus litoreus]|uniref:UxaA family hydrolase n=1 Tax=Haloplanus litoreus TaxID=767515 RepID=UPI0036227127